MDTIHSNNPYKTYYKNSSSTIKQFKNKPETKGLNQKSSFDKVLPNWFVYNSTWG
jgi:hypothetical protein